MAYHDCNFNISLSDALSNDRTGTSDTTSIEQDDSTVLTGTDSMLWGLIVDSELDYAFEARTRPESTEWLLERLRDLEYQIRDIFEGEEI